ncbi:uncharacterized protein LOC118442403 [Vespa mandarinia]|uniref:uncharacterized protein LOC118442403 n=1 Tax=Vespa mandarinia TaxID=7446 RepID=UPI001607A9FE|nr:uncharacterized protein LOC118442403 [Vespa mandarinia]
MFSINMRLFKTTTLLLLFAFVGTHVRCLPIEESSSTTSSSSSTLSNTGDHYDQRQNGTDNYRIHVDGVVVVVAPVEALLLAGDVIGTNQSDISLLESMLYNAKPEDEKPNVEHLEKPTVSSKSTHRSSLRLMNLLAPFIRRLYHKE